MDLVEADPPAGLVVSLDALQIEAAGRRWPIALPAAAREAFVSGTWDATGLLLDRYEEVENVRSRLPYLRW
jgi:3-isopropylmalate/(R)-2-methylmalate dehydratase small subunit